MHAEKSSFLADMRWRGQIHQITHPAELDAHLSGGVRRAYAGFDPTADSLTIGNLVTIMALARFQRAGHKPIAVMGGGTGLIGDPSGKSAERQLNTRDTVAANVKSIEKIFDRLLDFSGKPETKAELVNNIDWLDKISYLDALRDIGKHFSVNMMIQKDSVRERLHNRDQGISYTEFSYMILQSYDFLHLYRAMGVTLQMGGSDQFGNIVGGCDLIRRCAGSESGAPESFGLTWPLVTKSDGGKFGKTESGAIWLSAHRTSPYAYYQFWLNAADADVVRFLKTFTFLSHDEINALEHKVQTEPGAREAQRALARAATEIIHGKTEMEAAENAAKALFSGDIASLPKQLLEDVLSSAPSVTLPKARLAGDGVALLDLLVEAQAVASKREAKEFLANGSISINGTKAAPDQKITASTLLHGSIVAIRRGKKNWYVTRWE
ncbi:MAG: tyrosine--tRNA ligase [Phycisphaerales bacterium]|nr:tyrosine--tRNA ligase [Phycisphaerales bacterium]